MATLVEWFAGITAVAILLKFLLWLFSPKTLENMSYSLIKKKVNKTLYFLGAVVISWFVIAEIGIVAFTASFLAVAFYYGALFMSFPKEMRSISKRILKERRSLWPAWIFALIVALWTLWALFY